MCACCLLAFRETIRCKTSGRFLAALTVLSLSSALRADDFATDPIDEIQVTASRRAESAAVVPAAVTVIGPDAIHRQKLITDALAAQRGVFLQQTTPGQGAAIIRGLKGSEVLHLVDGFRLNNTIFRNAPTQYLSLVPVASAERVEVLRGAPASLYGSDAVGGVVQVVSRFPEFDGDGRELRRDLHMAFDTADLGKLLRGTLEYGSKTIAGLLSAEYLGTGDRRVGGGERIGPSGYESLGGRIALTFNTADDRTWLIDAQAAEQPETPRADELVPGFGQTEPSSAEFFFEPNGRYFVHARHTAADALWSADWTVDLGWQCVVDDRRTRDFGSTARLLESNRSDLAGVTVSAAGTSERMSWIAGAEFYHDEVSSGRRTVDTQTGETDEVAARFPDGSSARQAALYGNARLRAGDRHSVSGGLRYSDVRVELAATAATPTVPGRWHRPRRPHSAAERRAAAACRFARGPGIDGVGAVRRRPGPPEPAGCERHTHRPERHAGLGNAEPARELVVR
ncbi:MAG: TonB-dependent receptor plug domain-containing protein [Woeseiaceae bacterium]